MTSVDDCFEKSFPSGTWEFDRAKRNKWTDCKSGSTNYLHTRDSSLFHLRSGGLRRVLCIVPCPDCTLKGRLGSSSVASLAPRRTSRRSAVRPTARESRTSQARLSVLRPGARRGAGARPRDEQAPRAARPPTRDSRRGLGLIELRAQPIQTQHDTAPVSNPAHRGCFRLTKADPYVAHTRVMYSPT